MCRWENYLRMIKNIHMVVSKNNPITMPKFKFFVNFCSVDENVTTSFIQRHLWVVIIYQFYMLIQYTNAFWKLRMQTDGFLCPKVTRDLKWPGVKSVNQIRTFPLMTMSHSDPLPTWLSPKFDYFKSFAF